MQTYEISPHGTSAFDVIHLPDQSFVVVGVAMYPPDSVSYQGWVMCTDLQGNIIWSRTYGDSTPETFTSVTPMDNELWVAGYNSSWPTLYKISLTGDSLWSKTFSEGEVGYRFDRILATLDGHLLVTSDRPVLSKLDTLGNVIWSILGPDRHNNVRALALLPEGGYTIACNTNLIWDFQDTIAIRVYWVSEDGTILDSVDFSHYRWNHAECILPISQNEVIIGGFTQPGDVFYDEYPLVFRANRAGQIAWQFIGDLDYIGREVSGVHLVNDSIWVVSYNLHSELGARDPLMHVFDHLGNPHGQLRVDADPSGYSYDYAYASASVESNAIIITGASSISGFPWKAFLALVSSTNGTDDQLREEPSTPIHTQLTFRVSSDNVTMFLPEHIQGELNAVVYNVLGQIVFKTHLIVSHSNAVTFLMNVPSGKYFVTASHGQNFWTGNVTILH